MRHALEETLASHAAAYTRGEPEISDADYDQLVEEYEELYGPYTVVGSRADSDKTTLPFYLGSLDKIKTDTQVARWATKHPGPYMIQDKVDGISLCYTGDRLYTRGDGSVGQDVSHLLSFLSLPSTSIPIRGEVVMEKKEFSRHDARNARNLVSGLFSTKKCNFDDACEKKAASLRFLAFRVFRDDLTPIQQHKWCIEHGFDTPYTECVDTLSHNNLSVRLSQRRNTAPYEIDGLAISSSAVEYVDGNNPDGAIAFKETLGQVTRTRVTDVVWRGSKARRLIPTIHIEPITLSGATLSRMSGDNARFILDHNIGPGAVVDVTRSGDVIPRIVNIVTPCPDNASTPDEKYSFDGVHFILEADTKEVLASRLSHFVSQLGIKYIGEKRLSVLAERDIDSSRMIRMTESDWTLIPRIGSDTAAKILSEVERAITHVPLWRIMAASNLFPGLGPRRLRSIVEACPRLMHETPSIDELISIEGLNKLVTQFADALDAFRDWWRQHPSLTSHRTDDKTRTTRFVFSGFRDQALASRLSSQLHGECVDTVTRNVSFVVAKDPSSTSRKLERARQLGIEIVSRDTM